MADNLVFDINFKHDPADIAAIRKAIQSKLSGVALQVEPTLSGGTVRGIPRGQEERFELQQKVIGQLGRALENLRASALATGDKLVDTASKIEKISSQLESTSSRRTGRRDRLLGERQALEKEFEQQAIAHDKLQAEVRETARALAGLRKIFSATSGLTQIQGTRPLSSPKLEPGIPSPLSTKDKRELEKIFKQFDQLKGVAFDLKHGLVRFTGSLATANANLGGIDFKVGDKIFHELDSATKRLAEAVIQRFQAEKALALQEENLAKQAAEDAAQRAQNLANARRIARDYEKAGNKQAEAALKEIEDREKSAKRQAEKDARKQKKQNERDVLREAAKQVELARTLNRLDEERAAKQREILLAMNQRLKEERVRFKGGGQAQLFGIPSNGAAALGNIDPRDQQKFMRILLEQEEALRKTGRQFRTHNGNIAAGTELVNRLTSNLDSGRKAAFQFGFAAADAAARLAAWSIPASFLFNAVVSLKSAGRELVALDSQARRLAFFQSADEISDGFLNAADASAAMRQKTSSNMRAIVDEAQRAGLSVTEVARAVFAVQKLGVPGGALGPGGQPTPFLRAIEGAVRLEKGEIDAGRAAELLFATLRQSTDSVEEFNKAAQDSERIMALLLSAAGKSSLNLSDLGLVLNGILPVFKNLRGVGLEEAIEFSAIAAGLLGTNASRTRTVFKQLDRLAVTFKDQIKETSGIEVVDENGIIRTKEGFFAILDAIRDMKNTVAGFNLADHIAEADQIPEILAIADAAPEIRKALSRIREDAEGQTSRNALLAFFAGTEEASKSLEASFNRLHLSLVRFVESSGVVNLFVSLADSGTIVGNSVTSITRQFNELGDTSKTVLSGIAALLGGVFLSKISTAAGAFASGFRKGFLGFQVAEDSAAKLLSTDRKQVSTLDQISTAKKEGIISSRDANKFGQQAFDLALQEKRITEEILAKRVELEAIKKNGSASAATIARSEAQINSLVQHRQAILAKELAIRTQITSQTQRFLAGGLFQTFRRNAVPLISGALLAGATLGAEHIGKLFSKDGVVSKQITSSLQAAVIGGIVGFSAGGHLGAIAGAGAGLILSAKQQSQSFKELAFAEAQATAQSVQAEQAARRQIETTKQLAEQQKRTVDKQDAAAKSLIDANSQLEQINIRINRLGNERIDDAQQIIVRDNELKRLDIERNKLIRKRGELQARLAIREKESAEERVRLEEKIINIQRKGERLVKGLNVLDEARVSLLEAGGANEIVIENVRVEFNRQRLNAQIAAIRDQFSAVNDSLAALQSGDGDQNVIRSLRAERTRLKNELIDANLSAVDLELKKRKKNLELATSESLKQIDAWRGAAQEVRQALNGVFQITLAQADLIRRQIEDSIESVRFEGFARQIANELSLSIDDVARSTQDAIASVRAAEQASSLAAQSNVSSTQIGQPISLVGAITDSFSDVIANLNSQRLGQRNTPNIEVERFKAAIDGLESTFNEQKQVVENEIAGRKNEIAIVRDEIEARRNLIKSIKDQINESARRGRQLIEDPNKSVQQLRDILATQGVIRRAGGIGEDPVRAVGDIAKVISLLAKQPGQLEKFLNGLDASVERNIKLTGGLTPETFRSIALSIADRGEIQTAQDVSKLVSNGEQIATNLDKIRNKNTEIESSILKLGELTSAQAKIATLQANLAQQSIDTSNKLVDEAGKQREEFKTSLESLVGSITTEIAPALSENLSANQYFTGVQSIVLAIQDLKGVFSGKSEEIPRFKSVPQQDVLKSLNSEGADKRFQAEIESITKSVIDSVKAGNAELKETIKTGIREGVANKEAVKVDVTAAPVQINQESIDSFVSQTREAILQAVSVEPKFMSTFIEMVERLTADGIKVAGGISLGIEAKLAQELSANQELRDLLITATRGNDAEVSRILKLIGASIAREQQRDSSKLTAPEIEFNTNMSLQNDIDLFNNRF